MGKRKKQAIYILSAAIPIFAYGAYAFELGRGGVTEAVAISIAITLGGFGTMTGLTMLVTKNRLGWFDSKPPGDKPIFIKKEENMIKKQKPVVTTGSGSQSIELMKREKELEARRKELESLLTEVTKEEQAVEKELKNKGWILSADGWVVG